MMKKISNLTSATGSEQVEPIEDIEGSTMDVRDFIFVVVEQLSCQTADRYISTPTVFPHLKCTDYRSQPVTCVCHTLLGPCSRLYM